MAGRDDALRETLDALRGFGEAPEANRAAILEKLAAPQGVVVGKAAEIVGAAGWTEAEGALLAAWARLEVQPIKRDPGCKGRLAIVDALNQLGCREPEVFARAVATRQLEPSWGPPVDTAGGLRVSGAAGLARLSSPDFLIEAAGLLNDPEAAVRIGIVEVLDYFGGEGPELLLRMKVLAGDPELDVTAECLAGLMRVNAERSLALVAGFLDHEEPFLVESAALAIAESRSEAAFRALAGHYEANRFDPGATAFLLPISLTRHDAALDYLLDLISEAPARVVEDALAALEIHATNRALLARVAASIAERDEAELRDAFARHFPEART